MPPPRISDKKFKMPSCDTVDPPRRDVINEIETSFADFTQFPDSNVRHFFLLLVILRRI